MAEVYPPDPHYLRDLGMELHSEGDAMRMRLPIVPALCNDLGQLRAGVLTTAIDITAGAFAGRLAAPDWVATSDISLHVLSALAADNLVIRCSLVRHGRSLIVLRLEGSLQGEKPSAPGSVMAGGAAFSVLPSRGEAQGGRPHRRSARSAFVRSGSALNQPIVEKLGIRVIESSSGRVEITLTDYVRNTFGALQGGLAALLADIAMESRGAVELGQPVQTCDLRLRYLSQGRVGPFRTETEVLRTTAESVLLRVAVLDTAAERRLVALATGTVLRIGA